MSKAEELKERYKLEIDELAARIRAETLKSVGQEITKELIDYLYNSVTPIMDTIADEVLEIDESWLRNKARKFKLWFSRQRRRRTF